jgi:DNA-binding transcriptional LysR family regulator
MTVMPVTLEQARALDAFARHGTFTAAAQALRKGHTAVLYALATLEAQTELELLDRRAYRTRLTAAGERILEECRHLLAAEAALESACVELKSGWEPWLKIVFDGVVPAAPILAAVGELVRSGVPTRFDVRAEFLAGVEDTFAREGADVMISVLPPKAVTLAKISLAKVAMSLLAHRDHPLVAAAGRGRAQAKAHTPARRALTDHVLLTVRGSDPRLSLPTAGLEGHSTIHLNDFASKKAAILAGLGFGWLPDDMTVAERARGTLVPIRWSGRSHHQLRPHLYQRPTPPLGRAGAHLVARLTGS